MAPRKHVLKKEGEIKYNGTLPVDIFNRLKDFALHNERSLNSTIKIILREYFQMAKE